MVNAPFMLRTENPVVLPHVALILIRIDYKVKASRLRSTDRYLLFLYSFQSVTWGVNVIITTLRSTTKYPCKNENFLLERA